MEIYEVALEKNGCKKEMVGWWLWVFGIYRKMAGKGAFLVRFGGPFKYTVGLNYGRGRPNKMRQEGQKTEKKGSVDA